MSTDIRGHEALLYHHSLGGSGSLELRRCVKVEVDVLGSPSIIVRTVSVDVEVDVLDSSSLIVRTVSVDVEVDVLDSPSLIVRPVSVDVKQH